MNEPNESSPTQAVAYARRDLLRHHPFLALIVLRQDVCIQDDIPERTIATSGKKLLINPKFFITLSPEEQVYVLAHCAWHCALMHPWRRENRDKVLWDMACDIEVTNRLRDESGMDYPSKLSDGFCEFADDFCGQCAEKIYDELESRKRLKIRKSKIDQHLDQQAKNPYCGVSDSADTDKRRESKNSARTTAELKEKKSSEGGHQTYDGQNAASDNGKHHPSKKMADSSKDNSDPNGNEASDESKDAALDNEASGDKGDKCDKDNKASNGDNDSNGDEGNNGNEDSNGDKGNEGSAKEESDCDEDASDEGETASLDESGKPGAITEDNTDESADNTSISPEGLIDIREVIDLIKNAVEDSKRMGSKGGIGIGNVPGCVEELLDSLKPPSQDWREILGDYVTKCHAEQRRWHPSSRRHIWRGVYLPSIRSERLNAVVAIDTSGSTCAYVERFFSEMLGIVQSVCSQYEITLIECDYGIQNVQQLTELSPAVKNKKWKVHGLGGTDFHPVFDYVKDNNLTPDVMVFFTDGWGAAPDDAPDYPVIWCLPDADGMRVPCAWGKEIRIPVECLAP